MPKRRAACEVQLRRSWVWAADAERRWLRAFRLLLAEDPVLQTEREEKCDGASGGDVRAGLDRSAGRDADQ